MIRTRAAAEKSIRNLVRINLWPGPMISCGANCDGWMINSRTSSSSTPSVSMDTRALKRHGKPIPGGDLDEFHIDSPHNQAFFPWYLYNWIVQEFAFFASVLAEGWGESQQETRSGRGPDDGRALAAWTWGHNALQPPHPPERCGPMYAEVTPSWNVFQQICPEHGEGLPPLRPRDHTPSCDDLVDKRLRGGKRDQRGSSEYRCLYGGQGPHRVALSCKSSLCLRCAKVSVDTWVAPVGTMLHAGGIYRQMVRTVPEVLRPPLAPHAEALRSPGMPCGVQCLAAFLSPASGKARKGGSSGVGQPHGRQGQATPPLPILATSGGGDAQAHKGGAVRLSALSDAALPLLSRDGYCQAGPVVRQQSEPTLGGACD